MPQTDDVSAGDAAPAIDDPLAAADPNPAYLAALQGALDLAEECRVPDLARAVANPKRSDLVHALLCHELAACHRLMMRFGAMADQFLSHTSATIDPDRRQIGRDAIGFAAIAARLMARYQQGALALPKVHGPIVKEIVKHITVDWGAGEDDWGPKSGSDGGSDPGPAGPADGPAGGPGGAAPGAAAAAPALRRGKLKNGNPSGDYLAAPRCGAKTRAGCACRQPAMTNGRCRLHGGRSTGARTAEGRRRAETARLVHGRRTAAVLDLRAAAAAVNRRLAWMTDLARACAPERASAPDSTHAPARRREISAGHGVDRSDSLRPLEKRQTAETQRGTAAASARPSRPRLPGRERTRPIESTPKGVARPNVPGSASPGLSVSAVDLSRAPLGMGSNARISIEPLGRALGARLTEPPQG
jgi:hypothetical protein